MLSPPQVVEARDGVEVQGETPGFSKSMDVREQDKKGVEDIPKGTISEVVWGGKTEREVDRA